MPLSTYRRQGRGGKGIIGSDRKEGEFIEQVFIASTHDYMLFFTNTGRMYWLKVYDVPSMSRQSRGRAIVNILSLQKDERICAVIAVRKFDDRYLVIGTKKGKVKKTILSAYGNPRKGGIQAIGLEKGDMVIGAIITHGNDEIVLCTQNGMAIRFKETDVRPMGRTASGVRGITLRDNDEVIGMAAVEPSATLLTVCEHGYGKRTKFEEYRCQSRGGTGIINIRTSGRNGKVVAVKTVRDEDEMVLITEKGMVVRIGVSDIRTIGRATQGVRLIGLDDDDRVVGLAKIEANDSAAEEFKKPSISKP